MKILAELFLVAFFTLCWMDWTGAQDDPPIHWEAGAFGAFPAFGMEDMVKFGAGVQVGAGFAINSRLKGWLDVAYLGFDPEVPLPGGKEIVRYNLLPIQFGVDRPLLGSKSSPTLGLQVGLCVLDWEVLPSILGAWGAAGGGRFIDVSGTVGVSASQRISSSWTLRAKYTMQTASGSPSWDFWTAYSSLGLHYRIR
jgi:hypothetical protein